jgi:hypothetical protein
MIVEIQSYQKGIDEERKRIIKIIRRKNFCKECKTFHAFIESESLIEKINKYKPKKKKHE